MLATAFVPLGDALIVLSYGGSRAIAFGVHGATAGILVVVAALRLRERRASVLA